ncbi:hypothetical protein [Comamonas guangdongensis]|uniref:DUF805 domain-containing protein n=1 Tax=Comamonas guangdongensis TaxID=510515 RepID=A0ABV3ZU25_9BURK
MNVIKSSKHSLIRTRFLVNCLFLVVGFASIYFYWPHQNGKEAISDWKAFTTIMSSVAATMVGFLVAVGALLYTVANTPLVSFLRKYGVEKRILFDLFSATCFWLICLFFSMFANFPMANISPEISGIISFGFSICGLLSFFPIGYSLWMILSNIDAPEGDKSTLPKNQDENFWTKPTDLD